MKNNFEFPPTQKLDLALKSLEKVILKKLHAIQLKSSEELEKNFHEISELKVQLKAKSNEIKMLKTIIMETASTIEEIIQMLLKINNDTN